MVVKTRMHLESFYHQIRRSFSHSFQVHGHHEGVDYTITIVVNTVMPDSVSMTEMKRMLSNPYKEEDDHQEL